ncbi:glycosyltransferase [Prevotella denticola]|uniref:Sugar transferase, PEP-CTERM/EpsH1 system associated n=1 Tax=Prevotella denticola TaxID=28129 RepID=A0A379E337_9BACT|nr:glycosyltransferase [Prevotella denticola]SUB87055.1 sugar transferase, PEP-CTERM/EpsH1 system associated [Prevotella denticola]
MKVIGISVMMPAAENIRGTSALPYHLLAGRDKSIEVILYSYNLNRLSIEQIDSIAKELNIKICLLPVPWWYNFFLRFLLPFRILLKYPIGNYISLSFSQLDTIINDNPDAIWIYGEELSRVSHQLKDFRRVHTLPDCESLYYYRMLGKRFAIRNKIRFWRSAFMYPKYLNMEKQFDTSSNIHYHLVGEADVDFLKEICPGIQAHFLRHPHYQVAKPAKVISFSSPKIKILFAGQYNLYMQQDADMLIDCLIKSKDLSELKEHYVYTFLGKGWEHHVESLNNAGYEVHHIKFVPDYIEEICKHDIQITPICIGTGTKGKVLDAIANGLLVIGSWYALENIAVEHNVSCMQYNDVSDIIRMLKDIYTSSSHYEEIAESGRQTLLNLHNNFSIAKQLFSLL